MSDGKSRTKSIFVRALEIDNPEAREAYLDGACGENDRLRAEVVDLLKAFEQAGSFLKQPAVTSEDLTLGATQDMPVSLQGKGQRIGPYKLLQQIGEGGMGTVYMAEQERPVRRKVALKIIKPGMDSKQVIARFEAERQALALMEHQNIARVLDAGTTKTGRPYFVMELVKGVPITEYCDHNKLTPRERLQLFKPVCLAIQHAHQKGVIHRDIKPSNVLICLYDGDPVPKVIDFGVAKATEQRLTEKTMFTHHGQIVGTLEYMSPEQAEMSQLDIDTRSDIYSLGVLLYELLTGTTPISSETLREGGFTEMLRLIRETEPDTPSTRLSKSKETLLSISAQRRTEPAKLGALFKGDLDWIVMKSLEKDRVRRYETAMDLARDIQRHLDNEPVEACPPSVTYRLRKLAAKHRAALSTAAALVLILLATTGVSVWQAYRATKAERVLLAMDRERTRLLEETTHERNRAQAAEQLANQHRLRAEEMTLDALHTLGHSAFHSARALLASDRPGRRWTALDAIMTAQGLLSLTQEDLADPNAQNQRLTGMLASVNAGVLLAEAERITGNRPTLAQLRSEAASALLRPDGRLAQRETEDPSPMPLAMQWEGQVNAVSCDGRYLATTYIDLEKRQTGLRIIDIDSGQEVFSPEEKTLGKEFPLVMALSPGARQLAWISVNNRATLILQTLSGSEDPRMYAIPETAPVEAASEGNTVSRRSADNRPPRLGRRGSGLGLSVLPSGLEFSPNANWLCGFRMAGRGRSEVLVWDLRDATQVTGRVIANIDMRPHLRPAFSPDGRLLAWSAGGSTVTLWDLERDRQHAQLELPLSIDGMLAFTPDGTRLVVHGHRSEEPQTRGSKPLGHALVWEIAGDRPVREFETSPGSMATAVSVSPDGQRIASGQVNGELMIMNLSGDAPVVLDHGAMPMSLHWSPDGKRVISSGIGACKVWELSGETALSTHLLNTGQRERPVPRFALSPDGNTVAIGQDRGSRLALFSLQTGDKTHDIGVGRAGGMPTLQFEFSPSGNKLVQTGAAGVRILDVEAGTPIFSFDGRKTLKGGKVTSIGYHASDTLWLALSGPSRPIVIEAESGRQIWRREVEQRRAMPRISRDGSLVAFHTDEPMGEAISTIEVCRLPSGEVAQRFPSTRRELLLQIGLEISPDNRWLIEVDLALSAEGVWSGETPLTPRPRANVTGTTDESWKATLWNLQTGESHWYIEGDTKIESMVFSPDGRYLATAQRNGLLVLWDIEGQERVLAWQAWDGAPDGVISTRELVFTADSANLAFAAEKDAGIRMLDLEQLNLQLAEYDLGW